MTLRCATNFMKFVNKIKRADNPLVNIRFEYGFLKRKVCYSRVMLYSHNSKFKFDQSLVPISEPSEGINPVEGAMRAAELLQNEGITAKISGYSMEDFKKNIIEIGANAFCYHKTLSNRIYSISDLPNQICFNYNESINN